MTLRLTLVVLAKAPCPGRSKTRLAPVFGSQGAAELARAALEDTLDTVSRVDAARRLLVVDGELAEPPRGFDLEPQVGGPLGDRIAAALALADGPALLIGMDTPQLTAGLLSVDPDQQQADAWFGPAADGGYWALGLRHPGRDARRVLAGVPMSSPWTGAVQRRRLVRSRLRVAELPVLRDVDEPADAFAVADLIPASRFARKVRELSAALPAAAARGRGAPSTGVA
jgi:uncharacterized protein